MGTYRCATRSSTNYADGRHGTSSFKMFLVTITYYWTSDIASIFRTCVITVNRVRELKRIGGS